MRRNAKRCAAALFSIALFAAVGAARADETDAHMPVAYAGVHGLALVGVHRDVAGDQHGIGAGPLIEIRTGGQRVALHLEGIPVVGVPQGASAHYGQATPALGLFNGDLEYALDSRRRAWFGIGTTIINQRTPLPNLQQRVESRLAGIRFVARYREPLRGSHFLEAMFGVAPSLSGADHYLYSDNVTPAYNKPERASELDASVAIGWHHASTEWLFGLRALNFAARFTTTGEAADRNVGMGFMLEWRHLIKK